LLGGRKDVSHRSAEFGGSSQRIVELGFDAMLAHLHANRVTIDVDGSILAMLWPTRQ